MFPKITVTFVDKSDGYQETYNGILTDPIHALYVGAESGTVFFGVVVPTEQEGLYLTDEGSS